MHQSCFPRNTPLGLNKYKLPTVEQFNQFRAIRSNYELLAKSYPHLSLKAREMFRKQNPESVEKAEIRLAGLKSIDPALDLGKGLTADAYSELIEETRKQVETYNMMLSAIEAQRQLMLETEKKLRVMTEKMLMAVAVEYGKESNEYKKAGGVRPSDRKSPERKKAEAISSK